MGTIKDSRTGVDFDVSKKSEGGERQKEERRRTDFEKKEGRGTGCKRKWLSKF